MPDNYGRMTVSEAGPLADVLYPRCDWKRPAKRVPYWCPKCGGHAGWHKPEEAGDGGER